MCRLSPSTKSRPFSQVFNITMTKYIQINDWIFEIKTVRAIKTSEYGAPYAAIANININGDSAYIDGLLNKQEDAFSRQDFATFQQFFKQLDVEYVNFDRFNNKKKRTENVVITPPQKASPILKLIK